MSPSPVLESPTILFVKRLAYRKSSEKPWQWFGPVVPFPFVRSTNDWYPLYHTIELFCEDLLSWYPTIEDYVENVKIIQAPTAESLDLVDLNAQSLSPLVFLPLP